MVAKAQTKNSAQMDPEAEQLYRELQKNYAPTFICKRQGDYFIGTFSGEMNMVETVHGEVLVLEFEFIEGLGTDASNKEHEFSKGDAVSYWFMGQLQHDAVVKFAPQAGEMVGVLNRGKRRNKADTFTYNDMKVSMPNRENSGSGSRKVSWGDVQPTAPNEFSVTDADDTDTADSA